MKCRRGARRCLVAGAATVFLLLILAGCGKTAEFDADAYRRDQEETIGFTFLREVPDYAQAATHPVADGFAGGSGTEDDPYQIDNAQQLELLSRISNASPKDETYDYNTQSACRSAHYVLTNDIVWNDTEDFDSWGSQAPMYAWEPICKEDAFSGTFDGAGHTISGLYIVSVWEPTLRRTQTGPSEADFGLFGRISGKGAAVQNLNLSDSFYQLYNVSYNVGGIVGKLWNGSISNCTAHVTIRCDAGWSVGGIAGTTSKARIEDCTFSGTISGEHVLYTLGGIAAESTGGTLINCVNEGRLYPLEKTQKLGGLVGQLNDATDTILLNQGKMNFTAESVEQRSTTLLDGCVNKAALKATGGLIGELLASRSDVVVRNCQNLGDIEAHGSFTAGLIGRVAGYGDGNGFDSIVTVEDCTNTGSIKGGTATYIGGLIGVAAYQKNAALTVTNCGNNGTVTGDSQIGGILGAAVAYGSCSISLNACENNGDITAQNGSSGGIVGDICFVGSGTDRHASILGSRNTGNVTGNGYGIGGVLGGSLHHSDCDGDTFLLDTCENTGAVSGEITSILGGIVGYLPNGSGRIAVSNCRNAGAVSLTKPATWSTDMDETAFAAIGGIVGAARNTVHISECTSESSVAGDPALAPYTAAGRTAVFFDSEELVLPCVFSKLTISD